MGALGDAVDSDRDSWDGLELSYHTVSPNQWTFRSDKIRHWVEERLYGRVLNACAGKTKLAHDHEIVRNDLDESRDADLHVDVCEIADHFEPESFGTMGYDRREVAVWNTLGRMNDYLSVIDEKPGELEAGPRWFQSDESNDKCAVDTVDDQSEGPQ